MECSSKAHLQESSWLYQSLSSRPFDAGRHQQPCYLRRFQRSLNHSVSAGVNHGGTAGLAKNMNLLIFSIKLPPARFLCYNYL